MSHIPGEGRDKHSKEIMCYKVCLENRIQQKKMKDFLELCILEISPPPLFFFFLKKMGILRMFACEETPLLALLVVRRAGGPRLGHLDQWKNDKNG